MTKLSKLSTRTCEVSPSQSYADLIKHQPGQLIEWTRDNLKQRRRWLRIFVLSDWNFWCHPFVERAVVRGKLVLWTEKPRDKNVISFHVWIQNEKTAVEWNKFDPRHADLATICYYAQRKSEESVPRAHIFGNFGAALGSMSLKVDISDNTAEFITQTIDQLTNMFGFVARNVIQSVATFLLQLYICARSKWDLSIVIASATTFIMTHVQFPVFGQILDMLRPYLEQVHEFFTVPQAQADVEVLSVPLAAIATIALSTGLFQSAPPKGEFMSFLKQFKTMGDVIRGITMSYEGLTKFFNIILDQVYLWAFGVPRDVAKLGDTLNTIEAWFMRVQHLVDADTVNKLGNDVETCLEVKDLFYEGLYIAQRAKAMKIPNDAQAGFMAHFRFVSSLFDKVMSSGAFKGGPKMEPLVIQLHGDSGVGKSMMTQIMMVKLLRHLYPEKTFKKGEWAQFTYSRCSEQEFWDGYRGQDIVMYDDAFQRIDSAANPNPEFFELIRMKNVAPYNLHMASLDAKERSYFCSPVVIMSSNQCNYVVNSLTHPQALIRRFDICVKVDVHPDFLTDGKLDMDKVHERFGPEDMIHDDVWVVTPWNKAADVPYGKGGSFPKFMDMVSTQLAQRLEGSKKKIDNLDRLLMADNPEPVDALPVDDYAIERNMYNEAGASAVAKSWIRSFWGTREPLAQGGTEGDEILLHPTRADQIHVLYNLLPYMVADDHALTLERVMRGALVRALGSPVPTEEQKDIIGRFPIYRDRLMMFALRHPSLEEYLDKRTTPFRAMVRDFCEKVRTASNTALEWIKAHPYFTSMGAVCAFVWMISRQWFYQSGDVGAIVHDRVAKADAPDIVDHFHRSMVLDGTRQEHSHLCAVRDCTNIITHAHTLHEGETYKLPICGMHKVGKIAYLASSIVMEAGAGGYIRIGTDKVLSKILPHVPLLRRTIATALTAGFFYGTRMMRAAPEEENPPSVSEDQTAGLGVTVLHLPTRHADYVNDAVDHRGVAAQESEWGEQIPHAKVIFPEGERHCVSEMAASGSDAVKNPVRVTTELSASGSSVVRNVPVVRTENANTDCNIPLISYKVAKPQMDMDVNATEVGKKVLQNAYTLWGVRDGTLRRLMRITFLRGRVALTCAHLRRHLETFEEVRIDSQSCAQGFVFRRTEIQCVEVKSFDENTFIDQMLLVFPQRLPAHPDILKQVVGAQDISRFQSTLMNMVTPSLVHGNHTVYIKSGHAMAAGKLMYKDGETEYNLRTHYTYLNMNTVSGDCGSFLIARSSSHRQKIFAMHVAGDLQGVGMATALKRENLERALATIEPRAQIFTNVDSFLATPSLEGVPEGDFLALGKAFVAARGAVHTQIVPSLIHGFQEPTTRPARLSPFMRDGILFDPMMEGLKKCGTQTPSIPEAALRTCLDDVASNFQLNVDPSLRRVFSVEEAVQGVEGEAFLDAVKRSSSAGYPWNLENSKGKTKWLGEGEFKLDDDLRKIITERIVYAKGGVRYPTIWTDTLKDERRPHEKVDAGKTRVFSAGPQDYIIAFRQYFLGFAAHVMRNRIHNEISVGTNVYGIDWERTALRLQAKGEHVIAGDFSNYDGTLNSQILWGILDIINDWYGDDNKLVRTVLWFEIANSVHLCRDTLYGWTHSQPSGNPLTALLNSMYNSISVRLVWQLVAPCGFGTMALFRKHVSMVSYGDDNVLNISPTAIEYFNQHTITAGFAKIGMIYTDECKGSAGPASRKLDQVYYLKRRFVFCPVRCRHIAPMDVANAVEMAQWIKKSPDAHAATLANVEGALRELSLHSREQYDYWKKLFQRRLAEKGVEFFPMPYDDQMTAIEQASGYDC